MYIKVPYMFPLFPSSPFFISFNTSFFNTFQAPPFLHPRFPFMVKKLPESRSDIHSLHWTDTPWMPQIKLDSLNFCYCLILKARRFSSDNGFLPPGKSLDLLRALHQSVAMITKCIKDQGVQRVPYLLWLPLIRWNALNNFRTQLIIMEVRPLTVFVHTIQQASQCPWCIWFLSIFFALTFLTRHLSWLLSVKESSW